MKDSKKNIIAAVFTVLAFTGIIVLANFRSSANKLPSNANISDTTKPDSLVAIDSFHDFGIISMANGEVKNTYFLRNSGIEDLIIKKIYTSCMCTKAYLTLNTEKKIGPFGMAGHGFIPNINEKIGAGKEITIEAIFDPAAHGPAGIGPIQRTVFIETNNGTTQLEFKAMVTP